MNTTSVFHSINLMRLLWHLTMVWCVPLGSSAGKDLEKGTRKADAKLLIGRLKAEAKAWWGYVTQTRLIWDSWRTFACRRSLFCWSRIIRSSCHGPANQPATSNTKAPFCNFQTTLKWHLICLRIWARHVSLSPRELQRTNARSDAGSINSRQQTCN